MEQKPGHEEIPLKEPPMEPPAEVPVVETFEPLIVIQTRKKKPKYNNNGRLSRLRRKHSNN